MPNNEVDIVVKTRNESKPGLQEAEKDVKKLGEEGETAGKLIGGLAAALGPGLIPIAGAAAGAAIGLGSALSGAAVAGGVFKAVLTSAFGNVKEESDKIEALSDKAKEYGEEAKRAQAAGDSKAQTAALDKQKETVAELAQAVKLLPPAQRDAVRGYQSMKNSWQDFIDRNSPQTYGLITKGTRLLGSHVKDLQPLFDVASRFATRFIDSLSKWADSGGLKDLVGFLASNAETAFISLYNIIGNVVTIIGHLGTATNNTGQGILDWISQMSDKAADFAKEGGFEKFFDNMNENGPGIVEMLGNLLQSIGKIADAVTPLAPISLAFAEGLSAIINAAPPGVITAIVGAFVAWKIATAGHAAVMATLAAKTKIAAGAQAAFNIVMSANPIAIVIIAVAALVAGLIVLYKKSETARNIMNEAFSGIGVAALTMAQYSAKIFKWMLDRWMDAAGGILHGAAKAFSWVPGVGDKLKGASKMFDEFRGQVDKQFDRAMDKTNEWKRDLANMPKVAKIKADISNLTERLNNAKAQLRNKNLTDPQRTKLRGDISQLEAQIRKAKERLASIKDKYVNVYTVQTTIKRQAAGKGVPIGSATGGIPHAAEAGVPGGNAVLVGENGPEIAQLPYGSRVIAAGATRSILADRAAGGGGGPAHVVLEIQSSGSPVDQFLLELLRRSVRERGGNVQLVLGKG